MVFAAEQVLDGAPGPQVETANLAQHFTREHEVISP
jgi:hypothetical protein